ncbi:MAG: epoxyqueuosine reductase QueH, partial [Lachnospiraceae bacterium]|nr:epoxyqueuosine reductase QueH [Lachnospiraceae bacterium]
FEITVFFYNPNIEPAAEYDLRLAELKRFISEMTFPHPVHLLEGAYDPSVYREAIKGLEREKEGGKRCEACFRLRLGETAKLAADGGFDYFTTTLSISPLKNAALLNRIGEEAGAMYGIRHLPSDFKKRNGYKRSIELSKEHGLYRQDYCGCVFSKAEAEERRKAHEH